MNIKDKIREIPNFPKPGISFKDITPLLEDSNAFREIVELLIAPYKDKQITKVVGIDAREFLLASVVAYKLHAGIVIARKKGKLPYKTISEEYSLEYNKSTLEMHEDAITRSDRVIIVDDVLATGGTAKAAVTLVEKLGGDIIGLSFLIELRSLKGRDVLHYPISSLITYE